MACAIERRHQIGQQQNRQQKQEQGSGKAQLDFSGSTVDDELSPGNDGVFQAFFGRSVPAGAIDEAGRIKDCPAKFDAFDLEPI
jgi:hypothetical protein